MKCITLVAQINKCGDNQKYVKNKRSIGAMQ